MDMNIIEAAGRLQQRLDSTRVFLTARQLTFVIILGISRIRIATDFNWRASM